MAALLKMTQKFNNTPFEYHTRLEITIDNITNLGLGVGRHNGWVIMVPNVAIGERVLCQIYRNHSNYSEADLIEVLTPLPERVTPKCPLFGICGGCQYQHLTDNFQRELKQKHIAELLQRLGGIKAEVAPVKYTPQTYFYRSKLTPHFEKNCDAIGFLKTGSRFNIVDVPQCPIATEAINKQLTLLRETVKKTTHRRGGTLLLRDTGDEVVTEATKIITQRINDFEFQVYAGEFFQNNPYILPEFIDYIVNKACGDRIDFLVDAYCGVGIFGIFGSKHFQNVIGIEINERAIELANRNAATNNITNIRFIANPAKALFAEKLSDPKRTSVIIDPPRKGCDEDFLSQLVHFAPRKIVYVSCGPDTQARDVKFLIANGYAINEVQPFDLFPQTRHIENVITLERA